MQGFDFVYQPIYMPRAEHIYGYECLLRISSAQYGELPAGSFLPTARKYPVFMKRIDDWAMGQIGMLVKSEGGLFDDVSILSFNLEPDTFYRDDFLSHMQEVLASLEGGDGLDPEVFCFEFPRSVISIDLRHSEGIILGLRALGTRVAIDNADYDLVRKGVLAVDMLKIDRALIGSMSSDSQAARQVKYIIDYSIDMGIDVCALGVESAEQEQLLLKMGCDKMQGYYYDLPVAQYNRIDDVHLSEEQAMDALIEALMAEGGKHNRPVLEAHPARDEELLINRKVLYEMPARFIEIVDQTPPPPKRRFRR